MSDTFDPITIAAKNDWVSVLKNYNPDDLKKIKVLKLLLKHNAQQCLIYFAAITDNDLLLRKINPHNLNSNNAITIFLKFKARRCLIYINNNIASITIELLSAYKLQDLYITLIMQDDKKNVHQLYANAS